MGMFYVVWRKSLKLTENSITPWIENMGYQNCFISAAFIGLACALTFLVMIKFGKSIRVNSREKYWQIVGENWEKGMGH